MANLRLGIISVALFLLSGGAALPQAMNGTYVGQVKAQTPTGCFASQTQMTVTVNGTSVTGNWMGTSKPIRFKGEMSGAGFVIRMLTGNGEPVTIQGNASANTITANISGSSGCHFWGALTKQ